MGGQSALKSSAATPIQQINLPILHTAQQVIIDHPARFKVLRCGRRFGKSMIAQDEMLMAMLRGEKVIYTAPTYGMIKEMWRAFLRLVTRNLIPHYKNETDKYIRFPNGGQLSMWSLEAADTIRGGNAHLIVNDECAFVPNLMDIWNEVLSPMLLDYKGRAYFPSTPKGRNDFWKLAALGDDPLQPLWQTFHYTTYDNPHIDPTEIDLLKSTLTQSAYEQEVMAAFMDDAGAVFRNIESLSLLAPRDPYAGDFAFGIDFARENDFTVICVIDRHTGQQVAIDRFNHIGWSVQRGRIKAMYERWKPRVIWAEANSIGSVNIEALQQEGLPVRSFQTTSQSKPPLIDALSLAMEQGKITLMNDPVQKGELQAFAITRLPSGAYRYEAASGSHDDTVIALALAWHGCTYGRLSMPVFMK